MLARSCFRHLGRSVFELGCIEQLDGFTTHLGRIGSKPLGCEETELCIRARRHYRDGVVVSTTSQLAMWRPPTVMLAWNGSG